MEHSHGFNKFYFENEIEHLGIFMPLNSEAEKRVSDMAIDHDYHGKLDGCYTVGTRRNMCICIWRDSFEYL